MSCSVVFLTKKGLLECKSEWNGEATTVFSRLPSLRRLQATPPLQISLSGTEFVDFKKLTMQVLTNLL